MHLFGTPSAVITAHCHGIPGYACFSFPPVCIILHLMLFFYDQQSFGGVFILRTCWLQILSDSIPVRHMVLLMLL